jgi:catechol 2,3-dioxygenase-like lactoylglutathione lyase family enzyme
MIDHVSLAVRDLAAATAFYERLLAPLGYAKLVVRPASVGFGKKYPELWLNLRSDMRMPCGRFTRRRCPQEASATASQAPARRR